jgi:hypothetical protein
LGFASLPGEAFLAPTAAGYATLGGLPGVSQTNLGVLRSVLPAAANASSSVLVNGTQIPVGPLSLVGGAYQNQYNGVGAMDWNAGPNDKLQMRYVQNEIDANNSGVQLPSFYAPTRTRDIFASVDETHNFGGVAINELRLGFTRWTNDISPSAVNFPGLSAFPNIGIQDLGLTLGQGFYVCGPLEYFQFGGQRQLDQGTAHVPFWRRRSQVYRSDALPRPGRGGLHLQQLIRISAESSAGRFRRADDR